MTVYKSSPFSVSFLANSYTLHQLVSFFLLLDVTVHLISFNSIFPSLLFLCYRFCPLDYYALINFAAGHTNQSKKGVRE
jgi:hypothetical protein